LSSPLGVVVTFASVDSGVAEGSVVRSEPYPHINIAR